MFFYEQHLYMVKQKQAEIEANAKHAWKWNKVNSKVEQKQPSTFESIAVPHQDCCIA